jgi:hypothetical protein
MPKRKKKKVALPFPLFFPVPLFRASPAIPIFRVADQEAPGGRRAVMNALSVSSCLQAQKGSPMQICLSTREQQGFTRMG